MSVDPMTVPLRTIRLPLARSGKQTPANPVTISGYTIPVRIVSATVMSTAGRSCDHMIFLAVLCPVQKADHDVDQLDADEWDDDASESVDEQIASQDGAGA